MSFGVLCVLRTLVNDGQRALLPPVLLGTIMVIMKAHLSPSQLHLIPHD